MPCPRRLWQLGFRPLTPDSWSTPSTSRVIAAHLCLKFTIQSVKVQMNILWSDILMIVHRWNPNTHKAVILVIQEDIYLLYTTPRHCCRCSLVFLTNVTKPIFYFISLWNEYEIIIIFYLKMDNWPKKALHSGQQWASVIQRSDFVMPL